MKKRLEPNLTIVLFRIENVPFALHYAYLIDSAGFVSRLGIALRFELSQLLHVAVISDSMIIIILSFTSFHDHTIQYSAQSFTSDLNQYQYWK